MQMYITRLQWFKQGSSLIVIIKELGLLNTNTDSFVLCPVHMVLFLFASMALGQAYDW